MVQPSHPYMTTGKAIDLWAERKYWGNDNGSVCYGLHSHLHSLQPFHQASCFGSWIEWVLELVVPLDPQMLSLKMKSVL